jgi:UDP-N-acetylmuramoyl-tripeptide--D-alanyl-D-alanine ligase
MSNKPFHWDMLSIANAVQGHLLGEDIVVNGVTTDSRTAGTGELFIALQGPNFDGHEYIEQAELKGIAAVLVSHEVSTALPQVVVKDTRIALGQLANAWRMRFSIPLIAITGSNGKTTVKELTTSILSQQHHVLATQGNLNNDIGVPLTLLQLGSDHTAAVIEMGANHANEIEYLTHIAKPTVAVITNAGPAHLEGFGDLDGVAKAKGEIYSSLANDGTAIINKDDRYYEYWRSLCIDKNNYSFGLTSDADFTAEKQGLATIIHTPDGSIEVNYNLPGEHNLLNALAATAACSAAGVSVDAIKHGLEMVKGVSGRLQLRKGKSNSRIIDDTYNANPASLKAALKVLKEYPGRHFLALGDMGELGKKAEQLHSDAGEQARESGVDKLYAIGKFAKFSVESFGKEGYAFEDQPSMISEIGNHLSENVTLLVKGSRVMKMENIVNALAANGEN